MNRMRSTLVGAAVAAVLLSGCSTIDSVVRENAEVVGIPEGCVEVYDVANRLLDLLADTHEEALGHSDELVEVAEALGEMDVERVEALVLGVTERSRDLDTTQVRDLLVDYRDGVSQCRSV